MVARWWVRSAVWLRDGDGDDGGETEWVMLFMKCTENECVPDCGKCKKSKWMNRGNKSASWNDKLDLEA